MNIDWTRPVSEIDSTFYAKYGLTPAEIAFIGNKVKPMM